MDQGKSILTSRCALPWGAWFQARSLFLSLKPSIPNSYQNQRFPILQKPSSQIKAESGRFNPIQEEPNLTSSSPRSSTCQGQNSFTLDYRMSFSKPAFSNVCWPPHKLSYPIRLEGMNGRIFYVYLCDSSFMPYPPQWSDEQFKANRAQDSTTKSGLVLRSTLPSPSNTHTL